MSTLAETPATHINGRYPRTRTDDLVNHERATLGAAMLSTRACDEIARLLSPESFHRPVHGIIFREILRLRAAGQQADPLTLTAAMNPATLAQVGNGVYLAECVEATPTAANGTWYAQQVRRAGILRDLEVHAARTSQLAAQSSVADAERAVELAQESLSRLRVGGRGSTLRPWSDIATLACDEAERIEGLAKTSELPGVETGWSDLDRLLCNLQAGQLVIIAGRPSMGKSCAGFNIAQHASMRQGLRSAIFSLEMPAVECGLRLVSAGARVPLHVLRSGQLDDGDWTRVARYLGETADVQLFVDDTPGVGLGHIDAELHKLEATDGKPDLVVVDYLQLMGAPGFRSREEAVASLVNGGKDLGKKWGVPVVMVAQLNRGPEMRAQKLPQMSDLRESGSIEQTADIVILLHRDDYYDNESPRAGEADFIVAKNRNGPKDTITMAAQLHLSRFMDMAIV